MAESRKMILVIGAVFSVALLLSAAVLAPVSADCVSAEDDGMSDEEKQAYIDEKMAELDAITDAQMREEYGISYEEYAMAAEYLMENPIVFTSDDDGNIVADSLDSVESGKCLLDSGLCGDNLNIYFDSVTWSTLVFFFSNEFVNDIVDSCTGKERNDVDDAEEDVSEKSAAYDAALEDYERASEEYDLAVQEAEEAAKQYSEAKKAYDNAVAESEKAEAAVDSMTATVNTMQAKVDLEQGDLDTLQKVLETQDVTFKEALEAMMEVIAHNCAIMLLYLTWAEFVAEESGIDSSEISETMESCVEDLIHYIDIGTYVDDDMKVGLDFGKLSITALKIKQLDKIDDVIFQEFRLSNFVNKNAILKAVTTGEYNVKELKRSIMDTSKAALRNADASTTKAFDSFCRKYGIDPGKAWDNCKNVFSDELKPTVGKFKTIAEDFASNIKDYAKNTKIVYKDTVELKTYQKQMDELIDIFDEDKADELSKSKELKENTIKSEIKESKRIAKEAAKKARGNIVESAKNGLETAKKTLKTAKEGLLVAKQLGKKAAAEAGKVACKAALKAALAGFGLISIIIEVLLALVMKFIMDHLETDEPEDGIVISIKVRQCYRIWRITVWHWVFPSINYIRAQ